MIPCKFTQESLPEEGICLRPQRPQRNQTNHISLKGFVKSYKKCTIY